MNDLSKKNCAPCEGKQQPFSREQALSFLKETPQWVLSDDGKGISRDLIMRNFLAAVDLVNKVAEVAEKENHHPDIHLTGYRKLRIELSTHAIKGLSENDFILAAKINALPMQLK